MALTQYISKMDVHIQATDPSGQPTGALVYLGDIYSVKINTKSNDNPVATFGGAKGKGGIAGYSDGYIETEITFDKAVPRSGEQFDILQVMLNHQDVVLFGNIGSPDRLDFTVVGPAVNEVARIAAMCRSVERKLLVSTAFHAAAAPEDRARLVSVGRYALRGVGGAQDLYTVEA